LRCNTKTPTINLFLIRLNGTVSAITLNSTGQAYSPVWDVHGERIFFANRQTGQMTEGIYSSKPDGTDVRLIVAGEKVAPIAVSPDGNYLVYGQRQPEAFSITTSPSWADGLWVIDLRDRTRTVIDGARFVGWQMKAN
jgi:Tol biopolymer transport system component